MFHTLLVPPDVQGLPPASGTTIDLTISESARNFDLWSWITGELGDKANNYSVFNVTINATDSNSETLIIGSNTSGYAFTTGADFPATATLTITNNGAIVGRGGNGGGSDENGYAGSDAMYFTVDATLVNNNLIGGGGGGGAGGDTGAVSPGISFGGGGGAGDSIGSGGEADTGGNGLDGNLRTGGSAQPSAGAGGALGAAGANGTGSQTGGAAGDAIHKNGKTVTITNNATIAGTISATT